MAETEKFPEIPGHRIEKKLGRGGMSDVYLGVQETLGRQVAIKILNPDMIKDEQQLQRFLNEARTASRLQHPNIVTIHDVGQMGDNCYIVMEYLQESLVDRIRFSPDLKLERREAFRITKQMARALAYAHSEGFIHRDIKPDNILFRKDNNPVLVDFGISRQVDSDSRLTTAGMIIGTPHYMSPEQCRGEKIDVRSDIYSLGVVLYEMLTGYIPYRADSAAGIMVKHIQEPIPQLPAELKKYQFLLDRMMSKEKGDRIQSAYELLQVMDNITSETPLDTIEATRPERWVFQATSDSPTGQSEDGTDSQPTVLTFRREKKKKHVWLYLFLVLLLGGGGYLAYHYFYLPWQERQTAETGAEQPVKQVDVSEPPPVIPGDRGKESAQQTPKDVKNTRPGTTAEPGAAKTGTDPGAQPGDRGTAEKDAGAESPEEKNYRMYLDMAQEYFKDGDMAKAQEKLDQASAVKTSDETKALQKQIDDFHTAKKEKEYLEHLSRALSEFNSGRFASAKKSIALAREIKSTQALEDLSRKIQDKEAAARRAARRKKIDDDAYKQARSRNTIFAYEKYLKKYPSGRHASEAKQKLDQLKSATTLEIKIKDDVAFEAAAAKNTIAAYEGYLKEYPYGLNADKAHNKIEQLKKELVKATKVKIEVQQIRFFESGSKAGPIESRTYTKRFPANTTRYVYTEITYRNKLYRIAGSSNRVIIQYSGAFDQQLKGVISPYKEADTGLYWRGMGWTEAGKWPKGTFTVTVFLEGKQVGKAGFDIY